MNRCKFCKKKFYQAYKHPKQKYCNKKCRWAFRYQNNRKFEKERSLRYYYKTKFQLKYYHKNKKKILPIQIEYKRLKYHKDKEFRKIDNIRKLTSHRISLKNKRCSICGKSKDLQKHHINYKKPFRIIILCRKHHNLIHKKLKRRRKIASN
jgi:hypothetical protein